MQAQAEYTNNTYISTEAGMLVPNAYTAGLNELPTSSPKIKLWRQGEVHCCYGMSPRVLPATMIGELSP
jgi:hypothetical protein